MRLIEEICKVTAKGQTTVPKSVRQALGVGYGGSIAFRLEKGCVTVHAAPAEGAAADPALAPFLSLLEADFASRPTIAVQAFPENTVSRLEALTAEIGDVDLDAPIEDDVTL